MLKQEEFITNIFESRFGNQAVFPYKSETVVFVDKLFHFLFGDFKGNLETYRNEWLALQQTLEGLLCTVMNDKEDAHNVKKNFFDFIPHIYQCLMEDAEAINRFDPAAQSVEEVIITYPGFYATAIYRLSNHLWKNKVPVIPRLFSEHAHSKTGVDIHPGATIGNSFFIDHGTGIVIGETAIIGNNVKIYQGVTLGALNVSKEKAQRKRHPTIGDNVVIYSGATILGGSTIIGEDSIIGGNVWLTKSVPPKSVVYHKSEITIRTETSFEEPLNFVI